MTIAEASPHSMLIKLDCVVIGILGVSGREILDLRVSGNDRPGRACRGRPRPVRLRAKVPQLREALAGRCEA